jgi:omega-6 fatty acid desaturase (delta-12 desaturase)
MQATTINWKQRLKPYQRRSDARAWWAVLTTLVPVGLLFGLAGWLLQYGWWLTLAVDVLTGPWMMRVFAIKHDCGHRSLFRTRWVADVVGFVCGVLLLTPYWAWARFHARHHATAADLDRRHFQREVPTVTVDEYLAMPWWKRAGYRVFRTPVFILLVAPLLIFVMVRRFTAGNPRPSRAEVRSIVLTNVAIAASLLAASWLFGPFTVLMVFGPTALVGGACGTLMVFTQHHFESTYWARRGEWDFESACLRGSSYFKLPRVLRFLSGNLGYHHIHHLCSAIPLYELPRCYEENPELQAVTTLTIGGAWKALSAAMWDEEQQRMITFRELRGRPRTARTSAATVRRLAHGLPAPARN